MQSCLRMLSVTLHGLASAFFSMLTCPLSTQKLPEDCAIKKTAVIKAAQVVKIFFMLIEIFCCENLAGAADSAGKRFAKLRNSTWLRKQEFNPFAKPLTKHGERAIKKRSQRNSGLGFYGADKTTV